MHAFIKHLLGSDIHSSQRLRLAVAGIGVLGMIAVTVLQQLTYDSRPLQVRELAGREVSMEKLADVFLGMDQIALENHYRRIWTYNGIIFLSALLLVISLKDVQKK